MFPVIRLVRIERRSSILFCNFWKGLSTLAMAASWLLSDISNFRIQFKLVQPKLQLMFAFLAATKFLEGIYFSIHFK